MRSAQLTGNLTREPELVSPNGSEYSLIKFSIANNDESKKNQAGQYEDVVSFFDVQYWTKNPQTWLNKLRKGSGGLCDCDVKQERWEQDGTNRSKISFSIKRGAFPVVLAGKEQTEPVQQTPPVYTPPADNPFPGF